MNTFDYEVTLSPENNVKFEEMYNDPLAKKIIMDIYQAQVQSENARANRVIETIYNSFKEGMMEQHYKLLLQVIQADIKSE
tara:strand:- start:320 stop:562 length:243 start_codon:yes stop_codon:yes gene_type:complete